MFYKVPMQLQGTFYLLKNKVWLIIFLRNWIYQVHKSCNDVMQVMSKVARRQISKQINS